MLQKFTTPNGVPYVIQGTIPETPSPVLLNIANDMESTLQLDQFNQVGKVLAAQGFLSVSLDFPSHGGDLRKGEAEGMTGWRKRAEAGEPFIPEFIARASSVLDDLINTGRADPNRIAACGTSRGGFLMLHFAAADPRPKCIAAFAPLTHPYVLREFAGCEENPLARQLSVSGIAPRLAGRPIWIMIGNSDYRVETDLVIAFTRRVIEESMFQNLPYGMELHVMASDGHSLPTGSHEQAAAWIVKQLSPPSSSTIP